MTPDLTHMRTFVTIVEERGISAAARRLGIAKSVCSRRLREIEDVVGAQLVRRTTRSVTPTELGIAYYDRCCLILQQVDEAHQLITSGTQEVGGPLRITVPTSFTAPRFSNMIARFMALHPKVRLEVHLSDTRDDLVASGFDVGIRIGRLPDSSLISRQIGETQLLFCAAPTYLRAHGTPKHPEELSDHTCLLYTYLASGSTWVINHKGQTIRKRLNAGFKTNNSALLNALAVAGQGIIMVPDFIAAPDIEAGNLVTLFSRDSGLRHGIHVVYPARRHVSATQRAFIDYMATAISSS